MELTLTDFRILYESLDGSSLPELLLPSRSHGARTGDIDWPAIPLDEAQRSLLDLIRRNYVVLHDSSGAPVSADDAARVIEDDESWGYPIAERNYYNVGVTDEGERAYEIHLLRFRPHGNAEGV